MGVDVHVLNFLAATQPIHRRALGRTLMLGRQGFHIPVQSRTVAQSILQRYDPEVSLDEIQPDGAPWSEGLFRYLGSTSLSALDASAFEGADIVHDLNQPVPQHLHGAFDTIFDGGTIEHIFDIPAVFQNVRDMLVPGGLFLSVNAANNQLGHGLYQFSPELMWRAFGPENGFSVEAMYLAPMGAEPSLIEAPDPQAAGRRLEIGSNSIPTYLVVAARRTRAPAEATSVYQSDYARAWGTATPSTRIKPMSLTDLANQFRSDKGTQHGAPPHKYTYLYDIAFAPYRRKAVNFLEMGLAIGGPEVGGPVERSVDSPSIQMWTEYFSQATIYGFDISDFSHMKHPRFVFTRGDSGSKPDLQRLARAAPHFDIIIDDASHASFHQQLAFLHLWPKLAPDGLYIIEDLQWQSPAFENRLPGVPKTSDLFNTFFVENRYIPGSLLSEEFLARAKLETLSFSSFPAFDGSGPTTKLIVMRKHAE